MSGSTAGSVLSTPILALHAQLHCAYWWCGAGAAPGGTSARCRQQDAVSPPVARVAHAASTLLRVSETHSPPGTQICNRKHRVLHAPRRYACCTSKLSRARNRARDDDARRPAGTRARTYNSSVVAMTVHCNVVHCTCNAMVCTARFMIVLAHGPWTSHPQGKHGMLFLKSI